MLSPKASKLAVHVVGRNSAIRSAVPEKPTVEPNMEWIGLPFAEIWPFEIFEMRGKKGKADDLYRGSMQSEDHRRTAVQYPPCSLDPMPLPTIRRF